MKLSVNNHANLGTKHSSLKPMAGGPSKINPPNSHPSNSIRKKVTEKTKVRLNFAIARGVLLLPSHMIINMESTVGYNNNLTRTTDDMKLSVNNHVNLGTKHSSLKPMAGRPSKINPPNSHPSNPIRKKVTEAQGIAVEKKPTQTPAKAAPATQTQTTATDTTTQTQTPTTDTTTTDTSDPVDTNHVNKALGGFGALVFVGFVFWASK